MRRLEACRDETARGVCDTSGGQRRAGIVSTKDAFASAMRALVAIDEPLRRRIADAFLSLACWDALHSGEALPPGVRKWLDGIKERIARYEDCGALSEKIRRWTESLGPAEARRVAQRFVDAFAEVAQTVRD